VPYEMPPIITATGGIELHGREGVTINFKFGTSSLEFLDLWFEVDGVLRNELTPGATVYEKLITLSQDDVVAIWNAGIPRGSGRLFAVRLYGVDPPLVIWDGRIAIRGYIEEPPA
jgi:hypothetical protein